MFNWLVRVFQSIDKWFYKGVKDNYFIVNPAPVISRVEEGIPERLLESDIPQFGADHEKMLKLAVKNFKDDSARAKWLKSMHQLRFQTSKGWVAESNANVLVDNRYVKKPISKVPLVEPDEILRVMEELDKHFPVALPEVYKVNYCESTNRNCKKVPNLTVVR